MMLCDAVAMSVRGHGGKKRVGVVSSADFLGEQVRLVQEQRVFTPLRGTNKIPVLGCTDTTPLWRAAATRCNVFAGVWPGGPATAGNPDNWVTWWVMDGSDDRGCLCAMEAEEGLNAQSQHLQSNCNVPLEDGTVLGYGVSITVDGKGMQVANYSPDGKCWSCVDRDSLKPAEGVNEQVRWGAFLRVIPPLRRVGDDANATARLCDATQNRLQQDVSSWVQEGDGWGVIGRVKELWGDWMQASQNIPQAYRVALHSAKKCVFLDDAQYQQRVVDLLKEYYPNCKAPNGAMKVYTLVYTMLLVLAHVHTLWRKKVYFSDVEVDEAKRWAKKWGQVSKLMGWKAPAWVHWTVCHSG